MRKIALLVTALLLRSVSAQVPSVQISSSNEGGVAHVGSMVAPVGSVNEATGTLNVSIPLITLPGRVSPFTLTLQYGSKIWQPHVSFNSPTSAITQWQFEAAADRVGELGWHLNLPYVEGGLPTYDSSGSWWGYGAFVITLPDGAKRSVGGKGSGLYSEDGGGLRFTLSGGTSLSDPPHDYVVTTADGTRYGFPSGGYPATITDRNGNVISIDWSTGTITDSMGHQITLDISTSGYVSTTYGTNFFSGVHYKDADGNSRAITFGITDVTLFSGYTTALNPTSGPFAKPAQWDDICSNSCYSFSTVYQPVQQTYKMLTSVTFANGDAFSFSYNTYGEITQVNYPSGGYATYAYTAKDHGQAYWYGYDDVDTDFREVTEQRVCAKSSCLSSEEVVTAYTPAIDSTSMSNASNDVVITQNSALLGHTKTVFVESTIDENGYNGAFQQSKTTYADSGTSNPVRSTYTEYQFWNGRPFLPSTLTTYLCDSSSSAVASTTTYSYDTASTYILSPSSPSYAYTSRSPGFETLAVAPNVTEKDTYAYHSSSTCGGAPTSYGTLIRADVTSYKTSDSNYGFGTTLNAPTLPVSISVKDGSGTVMSHSAYEYDVTSGDAYHAALTSSGISSSYHVTPADSVHRGNLTKASTDKDASNVVTSFNEYNDAGQPVVKFDANHNATQYTYDTAYPYPIRTDSPVSGISNYYGYSAYTGQMTSQRGPNSPTTSDPQFTYSYDSMMRLTTATMPDGGEVVFTRSASPSTWILQRTKTGTSGSPTYLYECLIFDGLGRQMESRKVPATVTSCSGSAPTGSLVTTTVLDGMGRSSQVSLPYIAGSETPVYTVTAYDGAGRVNSLTPSDGGTPQTLTYSLNAVDTYDESGNHWRRSTDALGRLTQVLEPDPASNALSLETDYQYDPIGNLNCVEQHGGASGTGCSSSSSNDATSPWRVRRFVYDRLSRLTSATNREAGTITYTYDDNGNVLTRTDARSVVTNYSYDALNRLLKKTYTSDSSNTPTSCYLYDSAAATDSNPKGVLTAEWTQSSTTCPSSAPSGAYTLNILANHDANGRIQSDLQYPTGASSTQFPVASVYSLNGEPLSTTLPLVPGSTSLTLTNQYDTLDRLYEITTDSSLMLYGPVSGATQFSGVGPVRYGVAASGSGSPAFDIQRTYDARARVRTHVVHGPSVTTAASNAVGGILVRGSEQTSTAPGTSSTAVLTLGGTIGFAYSDDCECHYWNTGTVTVTVDGYTGVGQFHSNTSTAAQAATSLAASLNDPSSPVTASVSGTTVTITSKTTGTSANYSLSYGYTIDDPNGTGVGINFTSTPSAMTGGAAGTTVYDSGSASFTVSGYTGTATWGSGSTVTNVRDAFASAMGTVLSGSGISVTTVGTKCREAHGRVVEPRSHGGRGQL
ncbi:MAG TPA: hypothetical protein VGN16_05040 [Acidobacteriaceae bacterium]|jgi:YD repeat-containing protein